MPIGVIVNATAVFIGSIAGGLLSGKISDRINKALTNVFGLSAVLMGISLIVQMQSLSAVILAMILGVLVGEILNLEDNLTGFLKAHEPKGNGKGITHEQMDHLMSMMVLFCFSGTGIFGALNSGITGDHSILFAKTILDFFTAIIFGSMIGYILAFVAIPQLLIGVILFFIASVLMPLINPTMINDFKACGGLITLAVGFKISNIKSYKVINLLPALIFIMPVSYLWNLLM